MFLATHRRSGTHLSIDLLRRHFSACRARKRWLEGLDSLYLNLDSVNPPLRLPLDRALARLARAPRPIVKTHADPDFEDFAAPGRAFAHALLADADVIAVHRDVRDVLASYHHYARSYDSSAARSLSQFIHEKPCGVSRPRAWALQVRRWREAGAHSIGYEEIVGDPAPTLERLAGLLDLPVEGTLPLLPPPLGGRWHARWLVAFSRDPEATTVPGAAGRPQRWREVLSVSDRAFIQQEAGELLIELGYEDSDAWVEDATSAGE